MRAPRGDEDSLERAVEVYTGPLLEGCYEAWVALERESREQEVPGRLETLADDCGAGRLRGGDSASAPAEGDRTRYETRPRRLMLFWRPAAIRLPLSRSTGTIATA